ncbi:hypothetical protein SK128_028535 [Halocaridina rubra]|uniref:Uncharacterized protein n=1 Tax=Halocaridina rubra TaxID=373956 RepID=A0AAN9AEV5_HALRR
MESKINASSGDNYSVIFPLRETKFSSSLTQECNQKTDDVTEYDVDREPVEPEATEKPEDVTKEIQNKMSADDITKENSALQITAKGKIVKKLLFVDGVPVEKEEELGEADAATDDAELQRENLEIKSKTFSLGDVDQERPDIFRDAEDHPDLHGVQQAYKEQLSESMEPKSFDLPVPYHANDWMEIIEDGGFTLDDEDEEKLMSYSDSKNKKEAEIQPGSQGEIFKSEDSQGFALPVPDHANDWMEIIEKGGFSFDEEEILSTSSIVNIGEEKNDKIDICSDSFSLTLKSDSSHMLLEDPTLSTLTAEYQNVKPEDHSSILKTPHEGLPIPEHAGEREVITEDVGFISHDENKEHKQDHKSKDSRDKGMDMAENKIVDDDQEIKPAFFLPLPEHSNDFMDIIAEGGFSLEEESEMDSLIDDSAISMMGTDESSSEIFPSTTYTTLIKSKHVVHATYVPHEELTVDNTKEIFNPCKHIEMSCNIISLKDENSSTSEKTNRDEIQVSHVDTSFATVTMETSFRGEDDSDSVLEVKSQTVSESDFAVVHLGVEEDIPVEQVTDLSETSTSLGNLLSTDLSTNISIPSTPIQTFDSNISASESPLPMASDISSIVLTPQWMRQRPVSCTSRTDEKITIPLEERKKLCKTKSAPLESTDSKLSAECVQLDTSDALSGSLQERRSSAGYGEMIDDASAALVPGDEYYKNKKKKPKKSKGKRPEMDSHGNEHISAASDKPSDNLLPKSDEEFLRYDEEGDLPMNQNTAVSPDVADLSKTVKTESILTEAMHEPKDVDVHVQEITEYATMEDISNSSDVTKIEKYNTDIANVLSEKVVIRDAEGYETESKTEDLFLQKTVPNIEEALQEAMTSVYASDDAVPPSEGVETTQNISVIISEHPCDWLDFATEVDISEGSKGERNYPIQYLMTDELIEGKQSESSPTLSEDLEFVQLPTHDDVCVEAITHEALNPCDPNQPKSYADILISAPATIHEVEQKDSKKPYVHKCHTVVHVIDEEVDKIPRPSSAVDDEGFTEFVSRRERYRRKTASSSVMTDEIREAVDAAINDSNKPDEKLNAKSDMRNRSLGRYSVLANEDEDNGNQFLELRANATKRRSKERSIEKKFHKEHKSPQNTSDDFEESNPLTVDNSDFDKGFYAALHMEFDLWYDIFGIRDAERSYYQYLFHTFNYEVLGVEPEISDLQAHHIQSHVDTKDKHAQVLSLPKDVLPPSHPNVNKQDILEDMHIDHMGESTHKGITSDKDHKHDVQHTEVLSPFSKDWEKTTVTQHISCMPEEIIKYDMHSVNEAEALYHECMVQEEKISRQLQSEESSVNEIIPHVSNISESDLVLQKNGVFAKHSEYIDNEETSSEAALKGDPTTEAPIIEVQAPAVRHEVKHEMEESAQSFDDGKATDSAITSLTASLKPTSEPKVCVEWDVKGRCLNQVSQESTGITENISSEIIQQAGGAESKIPPPINSAESCLYVDDSEKQSQFADSVSSFSLMTSEPINYKQASTSLVIEDQPHDEVPAVDIPECNKNLSLITSINDITSDDHVSSLKDGFDSTNNTVERELKVTENTSCDTSYAHIVATGTPVTQEMDETPRDEKSFILYHTKTIKVVITDDESPKPHTSMPKDEEGFTEYISKQERRRRLRSSCSEDQEDTVMDVIPYTPRIDLPEVEISEENEEQPVIGLNNSGEETEETVNKLNVDSTGVPLKWHRKHSNSHRKRQHSQISDAEREVNEIIRQMEHEYVLQKYAVFDSFHTNQSQISESERKYYEMLCQRSYEKEDVALLAHQLSSQTLCATSEFPSVHSQSTAAADVPMFTLFSPYDLTELEEAETKYYEYISHCWRAKDSHESSPEIEFTSVENLHPFETNEISSEFEENVQVMQSSIIDTEECNSSELQKPHISGAVKWSSVPLVTELPEIQKPLNPRTDYISSVNVFSLSYQEKEPPSIDITTPIKDNLKESRESVEVEKGPSVIEFISTDQYDISAINEAEYNYYKYMTAVKQEAVTEDSTLGYESIPSKEKSAMLAEDMSEISQPLEITDQEKEVLSAATIHIHSEHGHNLSSISALSVSLEEEEVPSFDIAASVEDNLKEDRESVEVEYKPTVTELISTEQNDIAAISEAECNYNEYMNTMKQQPFNEDPNLVYEAISSEKKSAMSAKDMSDISQNLETTDQAEEVLPEATFNNQSLHATDLSDHPITHGTMIHEKSVNDSDSKCHENTTWANVVATCKPDTQDEENVSQDEQSFLLYHTKTIKVVVREEEIPKTQIPSCVDDEGFTEYVSKQERRRRLRSSCSEDQEESIKDIVPYIPRTELPEVEILEENIPELKDNDTQITKTEEAEDSGEEYYSPKQLARAFKVTKHQRQKRSRSRISEAEREVDEILRQMDHEEVLQKYASRDTFLGSQWIVSDAEKSYFEMLAKLKDIKKDMVSELLKRDGDDDDDNDDDRDDDYGNGDDTSGSSHGPQPFSDDHNGDRTIRSFQTEFMQADLPHGLANWTDESTYLSLTPSLPDHLTVTSSLTDDIQNQPTNTLTDIQTNDTLNTSFLTSLYPKAASPQAPCQATSPSTHQRAFKPRN